MEDPEPDRLVRDLRAQIARAKAVMDDHREQAKAVGLAGDDAPADPPPR